jgi:long-chain acyl-CoA synthetase
MIVNFPESPDTVQSNIREITPHAMLFSPRLWESMVGLVQVKITETTWLNRILYKLFMPAGYRIASLRYELREPVPWYLRFLHTLGELAIFYPLRDKLGLTRVKSAYTSGAALNPDVIRFFRAIGVNIKQLYGSTEAQVHTLHIGDDVKFESVGVPAPGMNIKIAESGEILINGGTLFSGYYKNPEDTEKAIYIDENGLRWFQTGDAGFIDKDGHLIYLDRLEEMITLANGEKYSPQYLEGQLKFSPYISGVMTVGGEDKAFVSALINMDFDNIGRWAEKQGIAFTTYVDLSQKPEVYTLISKNVTRVNRSLPEAARIHRYVLLHKEFDADEGELTRTRKLRRNLLVERYQDMISAMYDGSDTVQVRAAVKYRDGREGIVETSVRIATMDTMEIDA